MTFVDLSFGSLYVGLKEMKRNYRKKNSGESLHFTTLNLMTNKRYSRHTYSVLLHSAYIRLFLLFLPTARLVKTYANK